MRLAHAHEWPWGDPALGLVRDVSPRCDVAASRQWCGFPIHVCFFSKWDWLFTGKDKNVGKSLRYRLKNQGIFRDLAVSYSRKQKGQWKRSTPWKINVLNLQITHKKKGKWSEPNLQGIMFQPLIFQSVDLCNPLWVSVCSLQVNLDPK